MKITPQNVFNAAWQAFIVERKRPSIDGSRCVYLNNDGDKCAVGLCIPDGHEAQRFTGSVSRLWAKYTNLFEDHVNQPVDGTFSDDLWVLTQAQLQLHDSCIEDGEWKYSPEKMRQTYIDFAQTYKLDIPNE